MSKTKKKGSKKERKIKLLVWGDSPAVATGFGTVIRGIFTPLARTGKYDIDIIGINDRGGWKNPDKYPYRIYPARVGISEGDYFGRDRLVASLLGKDTDLKPPWDIVFTLNDPFVLTAPLSVFNRGTMAVLKEIRETTKEKLPPDWHFKIVSYWPIDSYLRENWVEDGISIADYPVAYTEYGKREIEKADSKLSNPTEVGKRVGVIYHGVNLRDFFPLSTKKRKEFRDKYFEGKVKEETFLVTAIARNQLRKDLPRTMQVFKEFKMRRPDSFLYLHCQETDAWGSLREYARNWDLELGEDWAVPAKFSANIGYPIETLNKIYNASDVILSTSLGEGVGFYNLEGFATKTLVVAPNNTSHRELYGYDEEDDISDLDKIAEKLRGIPVMCYSTKSEWATYGVQDFERVRPLVNVEDAIQKLIWAYDNPDKTSKIVDRAYNWIQKYSWDIIAKEWDKLFQKVYNELEDERAKAKINLPKEIRLESPKPQSGKRISIPQT